MRIAVLGWGSLIWDPRELSKPGRWRKDGPMLGVEFARESGGGRLTLALSASSEPQRTYWTPSGLTTVETARENLQKREKANNLEDIHWVTPTEAHDARDDVAVLIRAWLASQAQLDAVIWTGLTATLAGDVVAKAVAYLTSLDPKSVKFEKAHEYVTKAPSQIQTSVRREMQQRGWFDFAHPDDLFE